MTYSLALDAELKVQIILHKKKFILKYVIHVVLNLWLSYIPKVPLQVS